MQLRKLFLQKSVFFTSFLCYEHLELYGNLFAVTDGHAMQLYVVFNIMWL